MSEQRIDLALITKARAKELESEIKSLEKMLKSPAGERHIGDKAEFRKQIRKRKDELNNFSPKKLTGRKANEAYATAKRLRNYIQERMPGSKDYYRHYPRERDKDGNPRTPDHTEKMDFERAVAQQMKFQTDPRIQKACAIYKNLMQRLDPDNPNVRNIENLRR